MYVHRVRHFGRIERNETNTTTYMRAIEVVYIVKTGTESTDRGSGFQE